MCGGGRAYVRRQRPDGLCRRHCRGYGVRQGKGEDVTSLCNHGRRPVVGIIGNSYLINDSYPVHSGGTMNSSAVAEVAGCLPLIVPSDPRYVCVGELLELCDAFLLTGGRPNVHPSESILISGETRHRDNDDR